MKINPDSPGFQRQIDSATTPPQTGNPFGDTLTSKAQPNVGISNPAVAQEISKQDLLDPARANAAIDRAVRDLMDKEFGGMCAPDREQVAAWLRSDPTMRAALLQRLTSST